jgi:hypothetical protein
MYIETRPFFVQSALMPLCGTSDEGKGGAWIGCLSGLLISTYGCPCLAEARLDKVRFSI